MGDQFTVPQFIEHKAKIVGPLTFQQFVYFGFGAGFCLILYFILPIAFFIAAAIIVFLIDMALAFGQSGGRPLTVVFKNLLVFTMRPKIYLWKKKMGPPLKLIQTQKPEVPGIKVSPVPAIVGKSHLKNLSKEVQMRTNNNE